MSPDREARSTLPMADREFEGPLPFDAKDPEATFPADRAACGRPPVRPTCW